MAHPGPSLDPPVECCTAGSYAYIENLLFTMNGSENKEKEKKHN